MTAIDACQCGSPRVPGGCCVRFRATLLVREIFLPLLLEHQAPEVDIGDVDVRVRGFGRHAGLGGMLSM